MSSKKRRGAIAEQINADKIKAENTRLRDAVRRRTEELEHKNRDLEIETALEKIRAIAMGMKKADDMLVICKTISQQLQKLSVREIRNVQTAIIYRDKGSYHNYEFYAKHNKLISTEVLYINHPMSRAFVKKMLDGPNEFFKRSLTKKKTQEWYAFQKTTNQFADKYLAKASSLNYYWYSLGPVALGISTYDPLTKEEQDLFVRFRNVFELSYRRFIDIQKAEAQTKEAQIETALEKVRSRAMAMHVSKELKEVAKEMRKQFSLLGQEELETCAIHLWDEASNQFEGWAALRSTDNKGELIESESKLTIKGIKILEEAFHNYCEGKKDYLLINDFAKAKEFFNALRLVDPKAYRFLSAIIKNKKDGDICGYWSVSDFKGGSLVMVTMKPPAEDSRVLLRRFANVFGLAYQRFQDIVKAEAQAKEAQVEAALERVRSRSLAMHKSDELKEVIRMVLEQFVHLKINAEHAGFYIDYKAHDDMHIWLADPNLEPFYATLPYFDTPTWNSFLDAKAKGTIFHTDLLDFKEKNKFYKALFKLFTVPEEAKEFYMKCKGLAVSTVLLDNVGLYIENFSAIPYTDEENKILLRFGKVFQQTYTRFLDLQKAEAQAREAQIEGALERVRSRTMAMHQSKEIAEIGGKIFSELRQLALVLNRVLIWIFNDEEKYISWWSANPEIESTAESYRIDYNDTPAFMSYLHAWQKRIPLHHYTLEGDIKKQWEDHLFTNTELSKLPVAVREGMRSEGTIFTTSTISNYGLMMVGSYEPLSDENIDIIQRFGRVFQQSYTRYLDVQKAEIQAREAQIEIGLERVRSRAMAMQSSDELKVLIGTMFTELTKLDLVLTRCVIWIFEQGTNDARWWMANSEDTDNPVNFNIEYHDYPAYTAFVDAWKNQLVKFIYDLKGDDKIGWDEILFTKTELKNLPDFVKDNMRAPERILLSASFNNFGGIHVASLDPLSEEHFDILLRFAKVFDLTYTRFLDLKNAEAQARESQIQLALERVRARTMAMQKSEELGETAALLFQQVKSLGIESYSSGFTVWENNDSELVSWMCNADSSINPPFRMPAKEIEWHRQQYESWKNKEDYITYDFTGREMQEHYKYLRSFPLLDEAFKKSEAAGVATPSRQVHNAFNFSNGNLLFITVQPVPEAYDIFKRFAKVFEQTYTRFLDLQKAEAQAKESQIQLALERVRARTMAMQQSNELPEAANLLFKQVKTLNIPVWSCGYNIWEKDEKICTGWMSTEDAIQPPFKIPLTESPTFIRFYESRQNNEIFYTEKVEGDALAAHYKYMFSLPDFEKIGKQHLEAGLSLPKSQIHHVANFLQGNLIFITTVPVPDAHDIFKRFANVFEQTYTRFLDLQKAEAQAREAQIEAALERVRSKAMAMHSSTDILLTTTTAFEEIRKLGIHSIRCGIGLLSKNSMEAKVYASATDSGGVLQTLVGTRNMNEHPSLKRQYQSWLKQEDLIEAMSEEELKSYYNKLFFQASAISETYQNFDNNQYGYYFSFTDGLFYTWSDGEYTDNEINILTRFKTIVALTFRRFLDLQKAEVQARESQIQLALERVRARTMAMHNSSELTQTADIMFEQVQQLGAELQGVAFAICDKDSIMVQKWTSIGIFSHPYNIEPGEQRMYEAWKNQEGMYEEVYEGERQKKYYEAFMEIPEFKQGIQKFIDAGYPLPTWQKNHAVPFKNGYLLFITTKLFDETQVFVRFGKVFEQTYTRFLDLQKAEDQAREAQIEAALERVRSKTMAMHNSNDVGETAAVMEDELKKLGIDTIRCGIGIMHEPGDMEVWTISKNKNNKTDIIIGWLDMHIHPLLKGAFESWRNKNESYSYELTGQDLLNYYNTINQYPGYPIRYDTASLPEQIHHNEFYFPEGILFAFSLQQITGEQRKIFKRFASVFGQTYRRYLDLKKAEAQAREAQIETALERVRSRTMAMQKSDELAETAAVLFQQLITLGIAPNRLYIILINKNVSEMEAWVTDEDGTKVSMGFTGNYKKNGTLYKMYDGWKEKKKNLVIDMQGEELQQYFRYLHDELKVPFKGGLEQKRRVQHIAYFSHGLIGMASPDEQPQETLQLLERFAAVFNLTFTRFNDLKIAEAHALQAEEDLQKLITEKKRTEEALTELRATQKQLIQSEKMASLGELTAGIAHEIQNPLNFVNNFSEVSNELIEELRIKNEKLKIEDKEVKELLHDISQNLEKINHHGKRADAIVKGMLQHSRSSNAVKAPTDINKLADEYLRLAYHGLRAKDKSFNTLLQTDFDETIGTVNIIPQDIGRVLLNLINNAFYAVSEKKKQQPDGYEPVVSIITKRIADKVEIVIRDNGNGIPQKILEKIFQPFFTTKPTGQGTGLGLSLAYDIVKAHNGELKVETEEGESSEFIIHLPL